MLISVCKKNNVIRYFGMSVNDDATGKKMAQLGLNVVCVKNENAISEIQILKTLNNTNVINITV